MVENQQNWLQNLSRSMELIALASLAALSVIGAFGIVFHRIGLSEAKEFWGGVVRLTNRH